MRGQLSVLTSWVNKANLQENDVIRDEFAMVEGLAAEYYEVKETMTTNGRKKKKSPERLNRIRRMIAEYG